MSGPSPPPVQQVYQPPGQSQAASQYLSMAQQQQPYTGQIMSDVIPGYENLFNAYGNNPYFGGMMGAANNAASMAGSSVAPMQFGGASSMYGLGNMAGGMAGSQNGVLGGASSVLGGLPSAYDALGYMYSPAMGQLQGNLGQAGGVLNTAMSNLPMYDPSAAGNALNMGMGAAQPFMNNLNSNPAFGQMQGNIAGSQGYFDQAKSMLPGMGQMAQNFQREAMAGPASSNFDPTGALHDRAFQQMQDQTNATNSMYGLSSSPYGAGVANQAANNFNLDWQNMQQQRDLMAQQIQGQAIGNQLQAAGGYGNAFNSALSGYANSLDPSVSALNSMYGTDISGITSGMGAGANAYGSLLGANTGAISNLLGAGTGAYGNLVGSDISGLSGLLGASSGAYGNILGSTTGAYGGLVNPALNTMSTLGGLAGSGYGGASDLGISGLNTLTQQGGIPYNAYSGQLGQMMGALNSYSGGAGAAMAPGTSLMGSLGNYLGIGQNAAQLQNTAQNQQYQAQQQANSAMWGGLGSMFGSAAGLYALSDRRAKDNIRRIGRTPAGIPLYRFTYKNSHVPQVGVMADEVEPLIPAAVMTGFDGFKRVDYSMVA